MIASYGTQVQLLLTYEVGTFSYVIPATIELPAVCEAGALQLTPLDTGSRKPAGTTLTVIVSVPASIAGGHNLDARLAHA